MGPFSDGPETPYLWNNFERRLMRKAKKGAFLEDDTGDFQLVAAEYEMIYMDYLTNILVNLIDYQNAPLTLDCRYLEFCLRNWGYARVGGVDKDHLYVLTFPQMSQAPQLGVYGSIFDSAFSMRLDSQQAVDFTQITTPNFEDLQKQKQRNPSLGVYGVMANKYSYFFGAIAPTVTDLVHARRVAKTLGLIKATELFNLEQMKLPFIGFSKNRNLTAVNFWKMLKTGKPFIELDTSVEDVKDAIQIAPLEVKDFLASLRAQFQAELNTFLTVVGVNTAGAEKGAQLLAHEVDANSQLIEVSGNIYLEGRKRGCDLLNRVLGCNIVPTFSQASYEALVKLQREGEHALDDERKAKAASFDKKADEEVAAGQKDLADAGKEVAKNE